MSEMITGEVQVEPKVRSGKTKGRLWKSVALCVDDEWYSGFLPEDGDEALASLADVVKGDYVELEFVEKGNFRNIKTLKILEPVESATSPVNKEKVKAVVARSLEKDTRISFSGNLKVAADVAGTLLAAGVIELGKTKGKQLDNYLTYVKQIASDLTVAAFEFTLPADNDTDNEEEADDNDEPTE